MSTGVMMTIRILKLPAIEVRQSPHRLLYSFALDGKLLSSFTTVSRISRGAQQEILGYQRPEVLSHIGEIREYIESGDPLIPNAIVVAFDSRVRFEPASAENKEVGYCRVGALSIPI